VSTSKTPMDSTNAWHPKDWPICDDKWSGYLLPYRATKFFIDICGLQPIMNTPPWLQLIMDTTYPTGPNQSWAPKENNEPQAIMSTQKETTSPNQLLAQDFGSQPIMGTTRLWMYVCDTWIWTPQNRSLTMSIRVN